MIKKKFATPLVTVCIPSYNHGKYINQAMDSVVQQTYKNLEIIVVDSYSTDNTDEVLERFNDSRIRVLKNRNHGSIAVSRNLAISNSNGEWIAFLDSDDWWTLDKINKCSRYFRENIDLIYHNLIIMNENEKITKNKIVKSRKLKNPVLKDLLINGNTIGTSSVIVKKSIILKVKGMNESKEMQGVEDFNTWLKISQVSDNFKLVSKNLGFYRVHERNFSHDRKFQKPTAAFMEFSQLLTTKEVSAMYSNYEFANVRRNFLANSLASIQKDLMNLTRKGRLSNRVKAIYMLLIVSLKIMTK